MFSNFQMRMVKTKKKKKCNCVVPRFAWLHTVARYLYLMRLNYYLINYLLIHNIVINSKKIVKRNPKIKSLTQGHRY